MRKRGQAATEFLMMYGWVILVVMIVFGLIMVYIDEPDYNTCNFNPPFVCSEVVASSTTDVVTFIVDSTEFGTMVSDVSIKIGSIDCTPRGDVSGILSNSGESRQLVSFDCPGVFSEGNSVEGEAEITYNQSGGLQHTVAGKFFVVPVEGTALSATTTTLISTTTTIPGPTTTTTTIPGVTTTTLPGATTTTTTIPGPTTTTTTLPVSVVPCVPGRCESGKQCVAVKEQFRSWIFSSDTSACQSVALPCYTLKEYDNTLNQWATITTSPGECFGSLTGFPSFYTNPRAYATCCG